MFELDRIRVLVLSIFVLWLGTVITRRVSFLRRFSIPVAVTGGLICSIVVALLKVGGDITVVFDLEMRDTLLLVFFSTIGLSAKFSLLKQGGRTLAILLAVAVVFLCVQNAVGVLCAKVMGKPLGLGLIAGSVSLAGGHGTAITWGQIAADAGLARAIELGLAFATFGLILGGLVGGPLAAALIRRHSLSGPAPARKQEGTSDAEVRRSVTTRGTIRSILLLAICLGAGAEVNRWLAQDGMVVPGFLTSMLVGIILTNFMAWRGIEVESDELDVFNDVSLHLFLAMSLMSMQLTQLAGALLPILLVLTLQVAAIVVFAWFVVFRLCGKDYDAAVIAAGFTGLGLGATPVGVANMHAVTSRGGPSPKAFLVVPLVGAFFLDIANALVIQGYIQIFS